MQTEYVLKTFTEQVAKCIEYYILQAKVARLHIVNLELICSIRLQTLSQGIIVAEVKRMRRRRYN